MKTRLITLLALSSFLLSNCSGNKTAEKSTAIAADSITNKQIVTPATGGETAMAYEEEVPETSAPIPMQPLEAVYLPEENMQQFLKKHNLAPAWLGSIHSENTTSSVFNGFYGVDRYRIEMYFASIEKDATQAHIYHVKGKSRFKQNIVPFEGQIIIDSISFPHGADLDQASLENAGFKEIYMAKGRFSLKEESTQAGSGVFAGEIFMDLGIRKYDEFYEEDEIDTWTTFYKPVNEETGVQLSGISRGSGFLMDGKWTSNQTNITKPILVAKDIYMISNDILENFMIGERDVVINPKYRKLGWDDYWSNEEWWNEAKPIL